MKDSVFTGIRVLSAGTLLIDTADTVLKAVTTLFNKNETILTAIEGKQLKHDLRPYFIKPQTGSVLFGADSGAIKDTVWEWTPPYGSKDTVLVTISATNDTIVSQLKCTLLITPSDTTRPELSIIDTSLNGKKVSSPQITVQAIAKDSEAGIDSVTITCGTMTTPAVLQPDSTYSGFVSGLQSTIPTEITITAVDRSMRKNREVLKCTVTYDSTADGVVPAITTPLPATVKVTEGETLSLNVVASGIPAPTYQWYKGNEVLENQISPEFSKSNVTADDSGSYHVVVSNGIGTPVISTKTAVSIRLKAKITQQPVAASIKEGGNGSFTVKARGEAPLTYQWYKNGELITGAASSEYSFTNTDTTDNGKRFTCIVSNAISKDTSTAGILTVIKKPVYQVYFETGEGSIAPVVQHIAEGGKIVQPAVPARNGYDFSGWYKETTTTNEWNFASDVVNGPVTLYAKWIEKRYTITYYANGGTSGSAPKDSKTYTTGEVATILPNTGKLLKGNQSFCGWNTKEDGTGTNKSCGGLITITASVTLYAKYSTDEVMDNDGNTYGVTTIGGVTWMRQNLRTTKYNNGDPILQVTGEAAWQNLLGGAYCWPENNENNKEYGALYNWFAANTDNLAPAGWHVPDNVEWASLIDAVIAGDSAACKMIYRWSTQWNNPPACGDDYYGFSAFGNGCRECQGPFGIFEGLTKTNGFTGLKEGATWWTSTEYAFAPNSGAYYIYLDTTGIRGGGLFIGYAAGLGVRCVKDK